MKLLRAIVILLLMNCFLLPGTEQATAQPISKERYKLIKANLSQQIAQINDGKIPDTQYQFNPGFDGTKKAVEVLGYEDYSVEKYLDENWLHPEEKNLNQLYEEKRATRKEYLNTVDKKRREFDRMERDLAGKQDAATRKLENIEKQARNKNGYQSKRQQRKMRQQTRILNNANLQQQSIRVQKTKLNRNERLAKYTRLREKIAVSSKNVTRMQNSLDGKKKFDNGLFLLKVLMTAGSAEAEENYRAKQEGRPPLAINKVIIFTKGMTGYAAVEGLVNNTLATRAEAMKEALDYYADLDLDGLSEEDLEKRMIGFANRAAARTALYEGAKLLPVVGDAINAKEIMDAGLNAQLAIEESQYMVANNEEAQFQTSLRAAVNLDTKVRQMEAIAEKSKLMITSLGKIKGQLLAMEQMASANRDQVKQAINILEAYNEQADALSNPAIAKSLEAISIDALLGQLKKVKASAEEQIGNMQRVKTEHQTGQLTAQAVATQTKFIADLLQPTVADYKTLQPALANISAVSQGSELAEQVPQALELIRQAKPVMQKDGERATKLYEAYREQAGNLEQLARRFKELRDEMPKYLAYLQSSKNLEDPHQDKMRAALDRANNTDIDQTALRRALEDARGLRSNTEMVGALADLDKTPKTVETTQVDALVLKAQQAWQKISGPNQAAAESLQTAQNLLNELVAMAGDARPAETEATATRKQVAVSQATAGVLKGKTWTDINGADFRDRLSNRVGNTFLKDDFFGYKAFSYETSGMSKEECRDSITTYCPRGNYKMYRLLEEGVTTRMDSSLPPAKVPYWIALNIHMITIMLDDHINTINRPLEDNSNVKSSLKDGKSRLIKLSLPNADQAIAIDNPRIFSVDARYGPLFVSTSGTIDCTIGGMPTPDGKPLGLSKHRNYSINGEDAVKRPESYEKEFSTEYIESCVDWQERRQDVLAELTNQLLGEAKPLLEKMRGEFYYRPIEFNVSFPGTTTRNGLSFERRWIAEKGQYKTECSESYSFNRKSDNADYQSSWQKITDEYDREIDETAKKQLQSGYKEMNVSINGADKARMWQYREAYTDKTIPEYRISERILFRIGNILVTVGGSVRSDQDKSRTVEFANQVAAQILNTPTGW